MNKDNFDKDLENAFSDDNKDGESITDDKLTAESHSDENNNLENVMDETEDEADSEFGFDGELTSDDEAATARDIISACEGLTEENLPNSSTAMELAVLNAGTGEISQTIRRLAVYKPVVEINPRMDMIEIVLTFADPNDGDLNNYWETLEDFGRRIKELTDTSGLVPDLTFIVLPLGGMGVVYIDAHNPVSWHLQPEKPGGQTNRICMLFHDTNVFFRLNDETDPVAEIAAVMRETEADQGMGGFGYENI